MPFHDTIDKIILKLTQLNSIMKQNKIQTQINVDSIIEELVEKEKNYQLLKHDIQQSQINLENNMKLLKTKLDFEFQVYNILAQHKTRLNKLKEEHGELPEIDEYVEILFDVSNTQISKQVKKSKKSLNQPKPPLPQRSLTTMKSESSNPFSKSSSSSPKINNETLQSQLSAAIAARKKN